MTFKETENCDSEKTGEPTSWDPSVEVFVEEMRDIHSELESKDVVHFWNYIMDGSDCGYAKGGHEHILVNTNRTRRFEVTMRVTKRTAREAISYETRVIPAGAQIVVGCSRSDDTPIAKFKRVVVGERSF